MTAQEARQRLDMAGRVVQCRNVAQLAAAMDLYATAERWHEQLDA
jgi:hypothetical protein